MYFKLDYGQVKEARLFLKKAIIFSDSQALILKEDVLNTFSFDKIEFDSGKSKNRVFQFQMYASDVKTTFKRKYEKLFELVAVLGGMIKLLTMLGSIFLKFLHNWNINELIMNSLFVIRGKTQSKRNSGFFKINYNENFMISTEPPIESRRILNRSIRFSTDANVSLPRRNFPCTRERDKKKKETQDKTLESKPTDNLKLNFWEKILAFIKKRKQLTEKETLYLDYFRKSEMKLDLIHILKKLEEIDKLKMILLKENQIKCFNSITKQCNLHVIGNALKSQRNKFDFDSSCFEYEK